MFKKIYRIIIKIIDGALYGFIGPFSVLYIIPQFLMKLVNIKTQDGFGIPGIEIVGIVIMWSGTALAIWCAILMFLFGKGTFLVTSAPQKMMTHNIFGYVRNPMMWALFIIVFGEILTFGNLILLVWLIAMIRIIYLIVANYEEPQLERRFGESWTEYCKKVPAWIPRFNLRKESPKF
jgi:protein-S-isoprenylcysteine O-methyltransferase Ste14